MKEIISIFILCFSALVTSAQTTAYFKVSNHGTMDNIERVSAGGYISLGNDSVYKTQLVRWDNNFNPLWKYRFTDAAIINSWYAITEANDGSFYLMLTTTGHGGSASVLKFSSTGILLWQKEYYFTFGALSAYAFSKAAGTDNGFLFGGGQCAENNYIVKCDSSGNIVWQQQYSYPQASGVITCWSILPDGNNYVVSSGYNVNSLLTFRLDANGNVLAQSAYTYTGMQILPTRLVKLNSTGGYALLGNYNNSNNNKTQFVAIYNNALTLLSFNELTVLYTQFTLTDIAVINNGQNVIIDGSIYDNSVFYIATINLSNTGTIVWKHLATGNTATSILNVQFNGVTALGNSTVHCGAGYNEGTIISILDSAGNGLCNTLQFNLTNVSRTLALQSPVINPITSLATAGPVNYVYDNSPLFLKSFYCGSLTTSVDELEQEKNNFTVYPNPAVDVLNVHLEAAGDEMSEVKIFSYTGSLIFRKSFRENLTLNTSEWKGGFYFISVSNNKNVVSQKIQIIH